MLKGFWGQRKLWRAQKNAENDFLNKKVVTHLPISILIKVSPVHLPLVIDNSFSSMELGHHVCNEKSTFYLSPSPCCIFYSSKFLHFLIFSSNGSICFLTQLKTKYLIVDVLLRVFAANCWDLNFSLPSCHRAVGLLPPNKYHNQIKLHIWCKSASEDYSTSSEYI